VSLPRIKICGLTALDDALLAVELGAWAVGFIFYPKSQRYILPGRAAAIVSRLPAHVLTVGVFVNAAATELQQAVRDSGVGVVQLHGDEPPAALAAVHAAALPDRPLHTLRAVRPRGPLTDAELAALGHHRPSLGYVVDAAVAGHYGGTGQRADWQAARALQQLGPVLLSGGLQPDNVAAALASVRPFGLDVCSGVESQPGRKCPARLRALFHAAAGIDQSGPPSL
jgi:phosphoribosylanthranilate isomerase